MNWQELTAEKMTNYYLYGEENTPQNLVRDTLIRDGEPNNINDSFVTINITNIKSFFDEGPGRFANASNIERVQNFFNDTKYNTPGTYTLDQSEALWGGESYYVFNQYNYSDTKDDYTLRTYIYNTMQINLNYNTKFVIHNDGTKEILNFALTARDEDFDFESTSILTNIGNPYLEANIDPSKIGRTVKIDYPTYSDTGDMKTIHDKYTINNISYKIGDFKNDKIREFITNNTTIVSAGLSMKQLINNLWDNGTTKFIDNEGRTIIYGTNKDNNIISVGKYLESYWGVFDSKLKNYYDNSNKGIVLIGGDGDDSLIGTKKSDKLYGDFDNDILYGRQGDDYLYGGIGEDTLYGGNGKDTLYGGENDDMIFGDDKNDEIYGDDGEDILFGDEGKDKIYGGDEDDLLFGGTEETKSFYNFYGDVSYTKSSGKDKDTLEGGKGKDIYIVTEGDTIIDGDGIVVYNGAVLEIPKYLRYKVVTKGKIIELAIKSGVPIADILEYNGITPDSGLVASNAEFVLLPYYKSTLSIPSRTYVQNHLAYENWNFDSSSFLSYGFNSEYSLYKTRTLKSLETIAQETNSDVEDILLLNPNITESQAKGVIVIPKIDIDNREKSNNTGSPGAAAPNTYYHSYATNFYTTRDPNTGAPILNWETETICYFDPLVLDTNNDGVISTVALKNSDTYFDLTENGMRENTSWISSGDSFLVIDKNKNADIDSIDELFGNSEKSGFEELLETVDSNGDNIIDANDELFSELLLWNDINSNGLTEEGELSTLEDNGITSIDLNTTISNTELEGGVLKEVSQYTDSNNNTHLIGDINFEANVSITQTYIGNNEEYEIDIDSLDLPSLRGYGFISNTFISYNRNIELKNLAFELIEDVSKISNNFEEFILHWSGYENLKKSLKEKYSIENNFDLSEIEKRVWIIEKFTGDITFSEEIEIRFDKLAQEQKKYEDGLVNKVEISETTVPYDIDEINRVYSVDIVSRYEALFAAQSIYSVLYQGLYYDTYSDRFLSSDVGTFYTNVSIYLNSDYYSIEDKLYLIKVSNRLNERFFPIDKEQIISVIDDENIKSLSNKIYNGEELTIIKNENSIIDLADGNNLYVYNREDGEHTIIDRSGDDTIIFGSDITIDDLVIKRVENNLIIALKEDGVEFELLKDSITINDYSNNDYKIENIVFANAETINIEEYLNSQQGSGISLSSLEVILQEDNNISGSFEVEGNTTGMQFNIDSELRNATLIIDEFGSFTYTPDENYNGIDEVIISVTNENGETSVATITFKVEAVNDAPTVNFPLEEITLTQELTKSGQIQASDIDDDVLTYTIVENAKHGEFKVDENGIWKYNVDSTYSGEDSVIVQIDDLNGGIVTKTLNFNVDNNVKNGDDRTNFLFGNNEKNILNGLGGNDFIFALRGDDMILGGEGNDIIFAAQGDDMIWGGKGDDILDGHTGNDTYIFNIGDGNDTIFEYKSRNSSDINRILLGENITAENIKFVKDNNNLIIKVSENDSIKIMNWYTNQDNISEIIFDDGTKLLNNEILEKVALEGTSRKDTLRGTNTEDNMYALEGDDRVYGYGGNDLLNGGKGDDYLRGGDGDDIYSFSLGDGNDTIVEEGNIFNWNNDNKNDTVQFDNTISATDILFTWDRNNLIINYSDNDSIKIDNQKRGYKDIENFKLSDGSYLTNDDVEILIQNMTSFAAENDIDLTNRNEVKNNSELMNIVTNAWHHAS